jgi:hypothetical protein
MCAKSGGLGLCRMYVKGVQEFVQTIPGLWLFQEAPTEAAMDASMELETSLNNFLQTPVEIQVEQRPAPFEEVIRKVGLLTRDPIIV